MDILERIQRRATRRMSDVHGTYSERLEQLELTTLQERRARGNAIEVFKYLRGFLDVDKKTLLNQQSNTAKNPPSTLLYASSSAPGKARLTQKLFLYQGRKTMEILAILDS